MSDGKDLPKAFLERMKRLLGEEYEAFLASYGQERHYGLRCNPLKAEGTAFLERMPFALRPVSWAREGYYYSAKDQPGKHVLHEAGAYYIQEPSAMAVVEILDPQPGECILDLCAAPGGKSTQIAGRMGGEGLLVSNEIVPNRAKILSQNVERMGIRNCVVCNEAPERIAGFFPAFFDRIVVDAPCSGEGMFRKDETAVMEWSEAHVAMCAERQYGILEEAAKALKYGGILVYSTCTFASEENEAVIGRFLREHGEFRIEETAHDDAFVQGRADWVSEPAEKIRHTMRLMPHRLEGEGHYIARLKRGGALCEKPDADCGRGGYAPAYAKENDGFRTSMRGYGKNTYKGQGGRTDAARCGNGRRREQTAAAGMGQVREVLQKELGIKEGWLERQGGSLQMFGEQIYLVPRAMVSMDGMKVVRPGLHIGTDKKNRIEPSHALALALRAEEVGEDRKMELTEEQAERYLHGESLPAGERKGWTLLVHKGYPLGFGKAAGGQMKNHYPKGLRR